MTKRRHYSNKCAVCGKDFHPFGRSQPTCSPECAKIYTSAQRRNRITKTCEVCGNEFETKAYRAETAKYCSKSCWANRRIPNIKQCETCGKSFDAIDHRARFCSNECVIDWRTGDTSPVWKGGQSSESKRGKLKGSLKIWREAIYARDNYTCQKCGKKGGDIHAHHIKHLADFPELAINVDNGITVCVNCHAEIHGRTFGTPAKFSKHCIDCAAKTSGRSLRCHPCAIAYSWQTKRKHQLSSNRTGITPVIS